jgi:Pectate lyase superfamily protein
MTYTPPSVANELQVGAAAVLVASVAPSGGSGVLFNAGQVPCWYGNTAAVTTGTGTLLPVGGASVALTAGTNYYCITAAGTTTTVSVTTWVSNVANLGITATLASSYGATFNGVTDDTTAIQNAINATPSGGTLILPMGTAKITSALTINKSMRLMGSGCRPIAESISTDFNSINCPTISPYLAGTVIRQDTAATDAIQITGAGCSVDLKDFGILFGPLIIFTNTGHGINVTPPIVTSTIQDNGLRSSRWQDLFVMGHDGNHYGYVFVNPICCQMDKLQAFGGGGIKIVNNGITTSGGAFYGNTQFNSCYSQTFAAGSAHGLATINSSEFQNLNVFIRHQCTVANMTSSFAGVGPPTSAQYEWFDDGNSQNTTFIQPDFETNVGSVVALPNKTYSVGTVGWLGVRGTPVVPAGESSTSWLALARRGIFVDAICEYRADQITGVADATAISAWPDSSGNGFPLAQATGANQPTFYKTTAAKLINGLPAVWFDGTDDQMQNTSVPTLVQPVTLVAVCAYTSFTDTPIVVADLTPASEVALASTAAPLFEAYGGAVLSAGTPTNAATYIQVGVFNGANSLLRANGTALASGNAGSNGFQGGIILGASASISQWFTGAICHVILFPFALTVAQCQAVEAYLTNKWA